MTRVLTWPGQASPSGTVGPQPLRRYRATRKHIADPCGQDAPARTPAQPVDRDEFALVNRSSGSRRERRDE